MISSEKKIDCAKGMRIAKYIASAGICSRRQAEQMILDGRVKVDMQIITSPALNITLNNNIEIDGKKITAITQPRLWVYYKPVGLITTHNDPQNRPTVFESLKNSLPRVISVGRLDLNSEGLLLLTNNGELVRKLESPSSLIERVYKVRVYGNVQELINYVNQRKNTEIIIDDIIYNPKEIKLISPGGKTNSWFEVILTEGKNREIRKIFEYFGLEVSRLIRIRYGKYELGNLKPREFREVKI